MSLRRLGSSQSRRFVLTRGEPRGWRLWRAINESFTPIYYGKLVFIAYFNAGVRAVDIRDPFHPREVAFFIPAVTPNTDKRCVKAA